MGIGVSRSDYTKLQHAYTELQKQVAQLRRTYLREAEQIYQKTPLFKKKAPPLPPRHKRILQLEQHVAALRQLKQKAEEGTGDIQELLEKLKQCQAEAAKCSRMQCVEPLDVYDDSVEERILPLRPIVVEDTLAEATTTGGEYGERLAEEKKTVGKPIEYKKRERKFRF